MKIIAHRGASAERPENSFAAFQRAIDIGVDAIETDLLVTRDGRLVLRHDDLIQKEGEWYHVHELTLAQLQEIDIGGGERVPLLERFFDHFYGRVPIVLDLKTFGLAGPLAQFLTAHGAVDGVHITSFLHSEIVTIGQLCPSVSRSIATAAILVDFKTVFDQTGTQGISLFRGYVNESVVEQLNGLGASVRAYPVNLPREAAKFRKWGMEGIFTDDPLAMRSLRNSA